MLVPLPLGVAPNCCSACTDIIRSDSHVEGDNKGKRGQCLYKCGDSVISLLVNCHVVKDFQACATKYEGANI